MYSSLRLYKNAKYIETLVDLSRLTVEDLKTMKINPQDAVILAGKIQNFLAYKHDGDFNVNIGDSAIPERFRCKHVLAQCDSPIVDPEPLDDFTLQNPLDCPPPDYPAPIFVDYVDTPFPSSIVEISFPNSP